MTIFNKALDLVKGHPKAVVAIVGITTAGFIILKMKGV